LLLVLTALFWSGNLVLGRAVHEAVPPVALSFWRWAIALAVLVPFSLPVIREQWTVISQSWRILSVLGVLGVGVCSTLAYVALQTTTAMNGVFLNSAAPILIIALSWLFLGQRLSLRQAVGVCLSLLGVVGIITRGEPGVLLRLRFTPGDLWMLAAVLSWATYSVCLRWRPAGLDPVGFMGVTVCVGLLSLAPVYCWELSTGARIHLTPAALGSLAYVGLFPSVLSYLCWNRAVAEVGANRAGLFLHLIPVLGTLLSVLLLGESLQGFHLAGMSLVFAGIYLTTAATAVPGSVDGVQPANGR
jgi:drug/metabolite transporter (DMT)-like permease